MQRTEYGSQRPQDYMLLSCFTFWCAGCLCGFIALLFSCKSLCDKHNVNTSDNKIDNANAILNDNDSYNNYADCNDIDNTICGQ